MKSAAEAHKEILWMAKIICHMAKLSSVTFILPDGRGLVYVHNEGEK